MKSKKFFFVLTLCTLSAIGNAQVKTITSIKGESSATYLLVHPMHKIEATSKDIVYTASVDLGNRSINSVTADVDVTSFDSDNSNRDSHAMEVVDAIDYPEVAFSSISIVPQGSSLIVNGRLTFHGVTSGVTAVAIPDWTSDKLVVHATFPISLTTFKIERPSLLFIPVNDTLHFSLIAAFPLK